MRKDHGLGTSRIGRLPGARLVAMPVGGLLVGAALVGAAMVGAAPMAAAIVRHVVGGGGGRSSAAGVVMRGTAGQSVTTVSSGPGLRLWPGFWPGLPPDGPAATATGPTPGTPSATESAAPTVTAQASVTPGGPTVWVVNTVADEFDAQGCDAAHCSLREAITAANEHAGPDAIRFGIPSGDGECVLGGPCEIRPTTRLPEILDDATTIDGFSQIGSRPNAALFGEPIDAELRIVIDGGAVDEADPYPTGLQLRSAGNVVRGLVVHGFYTGLEVYQASGNRIEGCYVGTDATGRVAAGNACIGVSVTTFEGGQGSTSNVIGGPEPSARNLISGNDCNGVSLGPTGDNVVQGNYIGTDVTGRLALANEVGGVRAYRSGANRIGGALPDEANLIAFNHTAGVILDGTGGVTMRNTVTRNSIHDNDGPGIALQVGANAGVTAPEIAVVSASRASGTACVGCTVELFSDGDDEGAIYEGSTTADADGRWAFDQPGGFFGPMLTATGTDPDGNTSAFGAAVGVPGPTRSATPSRTATAGTPGTPGTPGPSPTGPSATATPRTPGPTGSATARRTATATRTPDGTPSAGTWGLYLPQLARRAPPIR